VEGGILKAFDVAPAKLVEAVALEFEKLRVNAPEWALFIKTGSHRERAPHKRDWWNFRLASILYRILKDGPIGTQRLRTYYGGRKNRGVAPPVFRKSGGKIIRVCLQELEKLGFVQKNKTGGRIVSAKGHAFLDKMAKEALRITEDEKAHAAERKAEKERERAKREVEERKVKEELRKIGGAPAKKTEKKVLKKKKPEGETNE
jgi:small subunit ribosomal protein S19e